MNASSSNNKTPRVFIDDLHHTDNENNPPYSTRSSSSNNNNSGKNFAIPLSPKPINVYTSPLNHNGSSSTPKSTNKHFNIGNSNSNNSRDKDQIFQLNLEIQSLKQRLALSSSTSKNELFDLLTEKDSVIANKARQISALNDKFGKITKAVNGMEREMNILRKSKRELEEENKKVNRYLGIREKEVNTLVSRCATQEEKLNDVKESRLLEKELNILKVKEKKVQEDHAVEVQGLMKDLQTLGNDKRSVEEDLISMKEANENLQHDLDESNMQMQEKREKMNQLYHEIKELHESKEKESMECIAMRKSAQDSKKQIAQLEDDFESMENKHKHEVKKMQKEMEDLVLSREDMLTDLNSKDEEVADLKQDFELRNVELKETQTELQELQKVNETLQNDFNTLKQDHHEESLRSMEETSAHDKHRVKLEDQINEKNQKIQELNQVIEDLNEANDTHAFEANKLKEKLGQFENELRVMTSKEKDLADLERENTEVISELKNELKAVIEDHNEMEKTLALKFEQFKSDEAAMKEEYENLLDESESQLNDAKRSLEIERRKAENYSTELETLTSSTLQQEKLRQAEMQILEDSVKAAKRHSVGKEEELINLKLGELKHSKDKVAELEKKIHDMEKIIEMSEMDAAMVVNDLNQKLVEASEIHARLEEENNNIMTQSRKSIQLLEAKISALEAEFPILKNELESKEQQLAERETKIVNITKKRKEQDDTLEIWKRDLDVLINAYEQCKIEHTNAVKGLQNEFKIFKEKARSEAASFQNDYDNLQDLASETEEKYEQQSATLANKMRDLDEKTKLLDDMVQCQTNLEQELHEARDMIAELQDVSEGYSDQIEEYKTRTMNARKEMDKRINSYLDELESEQSLRQQLESKVEALENKLHDVRDDAKNATELRAANYLLQDKIDRQEAYMRRKLEKEKRQRMMPPQPIGSPPRTNSTRSRSVSRKPVDSNVNSTRSRSQSISRRQLPPPKSDELDELLS